MDKTDNNHPHLNRSTLINLVVILAVVQAGILIYLWTLLRPAAPQELTEPTVQQFQLPSATSASVPADARPTPAPADIIVEQPVDTVNIAALARMFDEERALEHLAILASDELGGRQPGDPGGWAAGDYIAARFAEYGLQPAGVNNTYFQTFTVPYGRITEPPVLDVILPTGETLDRAYVYRTDYRALTGGYLGAGEGEGPVVWLNECLRDAYTGIDMVGKIALCRYTRNPEVYRQAIEHQVGGLLLLDRERDAPLFRRGGYRETAWVPETIPAYLISETVAQDLLIGAGYTLDELSLRFSATPLSSTARIAVTIEEQDQVEARNVLALLSPPSIPPLTEGAGGGLVIIGAHYDHLGREPDGAIMNGANDNGSGVATILEIARLWQAQNLSPAHSILFAAWDGEEQGLLGSRYYVEHPTLPLTRTVAMLNLDMVGTGETLRIDGEGVVAAQLEASAEVYGVTTTLTFDGRSDHVSFYQAGIPAAMPIWWPDTVYHTPDDEIEAIEPQKLKTVGAISAHTLAALAEGYVELERAVERMEASILTGDREAFLEGIDPTNPDLRVAQADWFDNLWSQELTGASIEPGQMRIGDGEANVALTTAYRWTDAERSTPSTSYNAHFVQQGGAWYLGGYGLDELAGDVVTVARFPSTGLGTGPDLPVETSELLSITQAAYVSLTADLELSPTIGTHIVYYPDAATMQAIARPTASAGLGEIVWGRPITPALVNLALTQMGLTPHADGSVWLREGMILHYKDSAAREYLPLIVATRVLTPLLDFPALDDLPNPQAQVLRAYAWSATEYLLDNYGADGLRALCAAWDDHGTDAFQQALGLSPAQFESAWRADRIAPLRADAEAVQATIAARVEAVLEGDADGWASTVTRTDPVPSTGSGQALRTEERNWFANLADHPVVTYSARGQIVGWSPGGSGESANEADVTLSVSAVLSGGQSSHVSYRARFTRAGDRWLYAGVAWNELASEHFIVKYNANNHDKAWAQRILDLAEAAYARVTADLDAIPPLPQEIKLYDDPELFRTSIFFSLPNQADSWTEPGEAIKLQVQDDSDQTIQRIIAYELTRQVLADNQHPSAQGLSSPLTGGTEGELDWLYEGIANFEVGRVLPLGAHRMAGRYAPIVQDTVRRHDEFSLDNLPSWEDAPDDQAELFRAQSWSLVSFIVERHGLAGLRRFIAQSVASDDVSANLRAALNVAPDSFLAEWQEYARVGGAPNDLVSLAQRFEARRALAHVAVLASPEFGGRRAGSPGADLAANYIAEQFAALGLERLGIGNYELQSARFTGVMTGTMTGTMTVTKTVTGAVDRLARDYLQQFPISYTHLISVPTLTLLDADGAALHEFIYRQDFMESVGRGIAEGELVWINADDLEGMYFGGAVAVEREEQENQDAHSLSTRAAQLQDHGAGGLIVVTDADADDLQTTHVRPDLGTEITIPVFQITEAAFETLLGRLGMEQDLTFTPPALPLGARMRQTLARPVTTTLTANVLGLLPGSDPDLADEVLVVGAHYDHIGQSPDGFYFPGANQNASGVGAMLEMARVWQSAGYRPARSVLFAAWGAEELDSAGVAHFLADPAIPLTRTVGVPHLVGVIALDSIAGGRGYKLIFHGAREHDQALIQRIEDGAAELDRRVWRLGNSDGWHGPFNQAGIPTLKLAWDEAEREFYSPDDTADAIDLDRLASSGEVLTLTAAWLAGW